MTVLDPIFIGACVTGALVYWRVPAARRGQALAALSLVAIVALGGVEGFWVLLSAWVLHRLLGEGAPSKGALFGGIAFMLMPLLLYRGLPARWLIAAGVDAQTRGAPIGMAYWSLRGIHVLVDAYLRRGVARVSFLERFAYLAFLPAFPAGPIHREGPFVRQLRRGRFDWEVVSGALERALHGYAKVVILGNWILGIWGSYWINEVTDLPAALVQYLDCWRYGLTLYVTFSGYSDIAIAFGLLFGIRMMENFDRPYLATSLPDFWRRWHISLSDWCRDYIYLPMVSATRKGAFGAIAAMLVLGLWHEFSWRYVAWGVFHGVGIALWRLGGAKWDDAEAGGESGVSRWWGRFLTLNYVVFSFALTKEDTLEEGLAVWRALLGGFI